MSMALWLLFTSLPEKLRFRDVGLVVDEMEIWSNLWCA